MHRYNELLRHPFPNLQDIYYELSRTNKSVQYCWGQTASKTPWIKIITAACYFNNIHLRYKDYVITRSSSSFDLEHAIRIPALTSEILSEDYKYLDVSVVDVTGNINSTFERAPNRLRELGYVELNAYSLVLKITPKHRIRVYRNFYTDGDTGITKTNIVILTNKQPCDYDTDYGLFRKIVALLPLLLVEHTNEVSLEDPLVRLLKLFIDEPDADVTLKAFEEYFNTIDMYKNLERFKYIKNFEHLYGLHTAQIQSRIEAINRQVSDFENRLRQGLKQLRDLEYERAGFTQNTLDDKQLDVLLNKKIVKDLRVADYKVYYRCQSPCLNFDKKAALQYAKTLASSGEADTAFGKIFKAAFVDESIVLVFDDCITLNFYDVVLDGQNLSSHHQGSGFRNPHHSYYNCWGTYTNIILQLIKEHSYFQLFLQIHAAVGSINMVDYTVLSKLKNDINQGAQINYPVQCIAWKEEKDMYKLHTINETLKHLEEVSKNENT